jgi:hypothetical protein
MLVMGGIMMVACVDATPGDEAHTEAERESSRSERAPSSRTNGAADAGLSTQDSGVDVARTLRDAGSERDASERRARPGASELDAEADDVDAGFPELAASIQRDCTETVRCDTEPASSLEECIAISTNALARTTPDARERFLALVMRCSTLRGCDYVSCTRQP